MHSLKKVVAYISLLIFLTQNISFAAEVLVDSGQRQTVLERTKQYAGKIDAIDVRVKADLNFQKNLKVHSGGSTSGENAKCGGYTISSCGISCCGEQECKSVCSVNTSIAHGNTCLSEYTTSPCGMSCCGKADCDRVCYNYRTSTVSTEKCGGYIKTATGENCCGLEDCRNKNCNGYTSTTSADYGIEQKCCGKQNCEDVKCDYSHNTDVISGGNAKCCGTKDCYSKYCEEMTAVDSKVYPDKKNLACCGKVNCHQVECDGYTQTNTPSGIRSCCGYEDCRDKECQYRRTATNQKGEKVSCCGIEECGNIQEGRTYEEPDPVGAGNRTVKGISSGKITHGCYNNASECRHEIVHHDRYYLTLNLADPNAKIKVTTGVAQKVPAGCSQTSEEEYDGLKYYHYTCKTASKTGSNSSGILCGDINVTKKIRMLSKAYTCNELMGKVYKNHCCANPETYQVCISHSAIFKHKCHKYETRTRCNEKTSTFLDAKIVGCRDT
ncbi:hypothetical protein [Succinivibrio dextrinosolvens]|uniref:hypothetical protein n=1 Tax=Succinivibrio dextrinosolvens TaxID=83771 RepID=UPI00241C24DE|nr:hypothetical protein [Succinivibrio dextrinosolvens]MBE6423110.1 hypothetical protein [Succinivibrio dextrinosolvens]